MNNMNFTKNPFDNKNNKATIAGNRVFKQSDGGIVSLDEIRSNMHKMPKKEGDAVPSNSNNLEETRNRLQSYKNIFKNGN